VEDVEARHLIDRAARAGRDPRHRPLVGRVAAHPGQAEGLAVVALAAELGLPLALGAVGDVAQVVVTDRRPARQDEAAAAEAVGGAQQPAQRAGELIAGGVRVAEDHHQGATVGGAIEGGVEAVEGAGGDGEDRQDRRGVGRGGVVEPGVARVVAGRRGLDARGPRRGFAGRAAARADERDQRGYRSVRRHRPL
jgi:hypothetical protein